eukprot:TRINITY_DN5103_c0_g1_i12.p1 TRINITY_DN5103_c0_g1~~TRINITY_DN5103_c0_g1_i12.p1  ORF type:complete len:879 (-),score=294.76 TRINITY_DN5103_c0_g1_i12:265-2832(-)
MQLEEQKLKESSLNCERRVQELYAKQGRAAQFKTVKERDQWINQELKSLGETISVKEKQVEELEGGITHIVTKTKEERLLIQSRDEISEKHKRERDSINEEFNLLKAKRNKVADHRKDLWRTEAETESEISSLKEAIAKAERQLYSSVSREVATGIEAIKRIKKEHNMEGVYAPIIELFTCTETEMTAVEVTAKGSLFNFVVDTDKTAGKLLEILQKEKAGRVTLMPLNKLEVKESNYPRTETTLPIIDRLNFKNMFRKAFLHIFGRTLLCSSLEEASSIAKTHNVDCITYEGDQINRKGALSGGYHDIRKSRLAVMNLIRVTSKNLSEAEEKSQKTKVEIANAEVIINRLLGELQELEKKKAKARDGYETFQADSSTAQKRILQLEQQRLQKLEMLSGLEMSLRQLFETQRSLKAERGSKLASKLTSQEEEEVVSMNTKLNKSRDELVVVTSRKAELEATKNSEQIKLSENLLSRQEELEKILSSIELDEGSANLDYSKVELSTLLSAQDKNLAEFKDIEDRIVVLTQRVEDLKENIEKLREEDERSRVKLQEESKGMEKLLNTRSVLTQKKEECQRKLRDIGSLPSKSQKGYQDKEVPQLLSLLHKTKQDLRAYSQVNKKALDQYVFFKEQRENLEERRVDLNNSENAIKDLIKVLDQKKDAAIERTFKMVAKFFSEVFAELTGEGAAQLVMQKRTEKDKGEGGVVQQYSGVDIKVSFSKSGKQQRMHQLSGGQQSLVALALIFAIQRCDPAPFYVFDEIDFALDDTYRLSVAEMIKRQSQGDIQFIITTHRPELVRIANKHYLIQFRNKVSTVVSCTMEDALELLEGAEDVKQVQEMEEVEGAYESSFDEGA